MKGYIYKITSPSGRIYIGQTISLTKRLSHYRRVHKKKDRNKIYHSIIKYGFESHQFEVIEEHIGADKIGVISILNEREEFLISTFDSIKHGLNILPGGGNRAWSEEQKSRMSIIKKNKPSGAQKGRVVSAETRSKISASLMGRPSANKGVALTDETKRKLNLALKGKSHPQSIETKLKLSKSHKGKIISEQQKQNIKKSLTGRKLTKEQSEKRKSKFSHLVGIKRDPNIGRKISEAKKGHAVSIETREKISKTLLGNVPWNDSLTYNAI